ncbi:MAG TPA: hypothetical protein VJL59_23060 [Anaerolineales bacterium]|nr:hypothetical protein [Anaerolineales bacterium]
MSHNNPAANQEKLLYISERIGGESQENAEVLAAIRQLWQGKDQMSPTAGSGDLRIDLVFDVPGPILGVDYEGVRTGRFSRALRMLQMQVAVPAGLSGSEIPSFLTEMLARTAAVAKDFIEPRKTGLSADAVETLIKQLIEQLGN